MVDKVQAIDAITWYWVIGDGSGWVTSDAIVPPQQIFATVNALIQSSLDLSSQNQVEPAHYVQAGLVRVQPAAARTPAENGPVEMDAAIADFTEALRLNPSDKYAYFFRAKAYEGRGIPRDEFALADLMEAIRLDSRFLPAYYLRGRVYEILAVKLWLQDSEGTKKPDQVPSGRVLAFYRKAYDDLNTVIRANPAFADALHRLNSLAEKVTRVERLVFSWDLTNRVPVEFQTQMAVVRTESPRAVQPRVTPGLAHRRRCQQTPRLN